MRAQRKMETTEERHERLEQEAQKKFDEAAANEAVVDAMIRRNIKQYGP